MNEIQENSLYSENSTEIVFKKIVSSDQYLSHYYNNYLLEEYADGVFDKRIYYYDIARIAEVINKMFLSNQTTNFPALFKNIEEILKDCDKYIEELIIVGLFEDMQNTSVIDYSIAFNEWLQPQSKKAWDNLIKFWSPEITGKKKKRGNKLKK